MDWLSHEKKIIRKFSEVSSESENDYTLIVLKEKYKKIICAEAYLTLKSIIEREYINIYRELLRNKEN